MSFYENGAEFTCEEDGSPLTSEASASHNFLVESVRSLNPGVLIIQKNQKMQPRVDRSCQIFGWWFDQQNCPLSLGNGRAVQNGARALHGFDVAGSVLAQFSRPLVL